MRVVKSGQLIYLPTRYEYEGKSYLHISVGVPWYFDQPNFFAHETAFWEGIKKCPRSFEAVESGAEKAFAEYLVAGKAVLQKGKNETELSLEFGSLKKDVLLRRSILAWDKKEDLFIPLDHAISIKGPYNPNGVFDINNAPLKSISVKGPEWGAFGAIPPNAATRMKFFGTIATTAEKHSKMELPSDNDSRYFQLSSPDQQINSNRWKGGEKIKFSEGWLSPFLEAILPTLDVQIGIIGDENILLKSIDGLPQTVWLVPECSLGATFFSATISWDQYLEKHADTVILSATNPTEKLAAESLVNIAKTRQSDNNSGLEVFLDDELMPLGAILDTIDDISDHPTSIAYKKPTVEVAIERSTQRLLELRNIMSSYISSHVEGNNAADYTSDVNDQKTYTEVVDCIINNCSNDECEWNYKAFKGVQFKGISPENARFTNCTFNNVEFFECNFDDIQLKSCEGTSITFRNSKILSGRIEQSKFDSCVFVNSTTSEMSLMKCKLEDVRLSKGHHDDFNIFETQIGNFVIEEACDVFDLIVFDSVIHNTYLQKSRVLGGTYSGCEFNKISIEQSDFRGNNFVSDCTVKHFGSTESSVSKFFAQGVIFDRFILVSTDADLLFMKLAQCKIMHLINCRVDGANFSESIIESAKIELSSMKNSDLSHTKLFEGDILDNDFTEANLIQVEIYSKVAISGNILTGSVGGFYRV